MKKLNDILMKEYDRPVHVFTLNMTSFLLALGIGWVDYLTGPELSFSIFYLLPVGMAAWFGGRKSSIFIPLLSAVSWYAADVSSFKIYSHPLVPFWNALVIFCFFLIVSLTLRRMKTLLNNLSEMAGTDPLTGLLNPRHFNTLAEGELNKAKRFSRPITICYIDVDNFKTINDNYGHDFGDNILCFVSKHISANIRKTDLFERIGGDEFCILFPETEAGTAYAIVNKIVERLLFASRQSKIVVTLSMGVVTFEDMPNTVNDLIRAADNLMYEAKKEGKNITKFQTVKP
jgi:diguanylate cyclase (GGDEF)-like protein